MKISPIRPRSWHELRPVRFCTQTRQKTWKDRSDSGGRQGQDGYVDSYNERIWIFYYSRQIEQH